MSPAAADALVLLGPRDFVRRTYPLPEIGDDDGLLRVEACGLCGTDHEQYTGHIRAPYCFVPGHEVVGIVERAGPIALARWGVAVGDRVAIEVFLSCGYCESCVRGAYRRCARHGLADMHGFIDAGKAPSLWGGYATHLYLSPDALVLPVPPSLDPVVATVFNPLGAGLRWAAELPDTQIGDVVVVLGPGIRGLAVRAAAKNAGAGFVMVTGLGPQDRDRLAIATRFGADLTVDVAEHDAVGALVAATGRLADIVIDVTAKAAAAPGQAVRLARASGTIVLAGTRGDPSAPGFDPDLIVYKELRVLGALGVDTRNYTRALDLLASDTFPFAELPRRTAGFGGIESLLRTMSGDEPGDRPVHAVFTP